MNLIQAVALLQALHYTVTNDPAHPDRWQVRLANGNRAIDGLNTAEKLIRCAEMIEQHAVRYSSPQIRYALRDVINAAAKRDDAPFPMDVQRPPKLMDTHTELLLALWASGVLTPTQAAQLLDWTPAEVQQCSGELATAGWMKALSPLLWRITADGVRQVADHPRRPMIIADDLFNTLDAVLPTNPIISETVAQVVSRARVLRPLTQVHIEYQGIMGAAIGVFWQSLIMLAFGTTPLLPIPIPWVSQITNESQPIVLPLLVDDGLESNILAFLASSYATWRKQWILPLCVTATRDRLEMIQTIWQFTWPMGRWAVATEDGLRTDRWSISIAGRTTTGSLFSHIPIGNRLCNQH